MWMNRLKLSRVTALVLLAYLTFSFAAGVFLADGTVHPIRRPLLPKDEMQGQRIAHAHQLRPVMEQFSRVGGSGPTTAMAKQ